VNSTIHAEWNQTRGIAYNRVHGSTLFVRNRYTYCYDKLMKCTLCTFKINSNKGVKIIGAKNFQK